MVELDREGRVRAAGGLVWRLSATGEPEYLIVHRPKYDDWTIPKGKADPGESDEQTAKREVREETGLECELEAEIGASEYLYQAGRRKIVRFWLMRPSSGELSANAEVDRFLWLTGGEARSQLTRQSDRLVLDSAIDHLQGQTGSDPASDFR